jgi:hypothetical protein
MAAMAKALQFSSHLLPTLIMIATSLISVGILSLLGKISLGAFLALIGGWLGLNRTSESSVMIEAGKYRITAEGVGMGILIAGILIIVSVIVTEVFTARAGLQPT